MKYSTGILMYVIAVNKSQEYLLNVRRLIFFFDDDARDLTSTTSRCFFDDVVYTISNV